MAFFLCCVHAKSILSYKAYFDLFRRVLFSFVCFLSMNFESGFRVFRQSIQKVNSNAVNLDFEYSIHFFFISILVFKQLKTV